MSRKLTFVLTLFLIVCLGAAFASAATLVKKPIRIVGDETRDVPQQGITPRYHPSQSPGTTVDSTYYDWQQNGGMDDRIAIYDNAGTVLIHATAMAAHVDAAGGWEDRNMYYSFWNGTAWESPGATAVFPGYSGFGGLTVLSNGAAALCAHSDIDGQGTRASAAYDVFPGLRAFSFYGTDPADIHIWPHLAINSDGSATIAAESQTTSDVVVARAADTSSDFGPWTNLRTVQPDWQGTMEWPTIESGTDGHVGIIVPDQNGGIFFFESTDNGTTWGVATVDPADTLGAPADLDSTAARDGWINSDIMYIGDEPHLAWTAGQIAFVGGVYGLYDYKATIFHWSPSTGIDTVVVAQTQSADSTRADYVYTEFNHLSVDWPSMGVTSDGKIVLVYTAYSVDDIDASAVPPTGYSDIWATASDDNGNTWSAPVNLTNPDGTNLGWEDKYPAVAKVNLETAFAPFMNAHMIYQSDDLAGTTVQGNESVENIDYIKVLGFMAGVGIEDDEETGGGLPRAYALGQNYPNPFNPSTSITYTLAEKGNVVLDVMNLRGQHVTTLLTGVKEAGSHSVTWDGKNSLGQTVSSGIYFYRLRTDDGFNQTRKMVLLK